MKAGSKSGFWSVLGVVGALVAPISARGAARVTEIVLEMPTYGFTQPNPIPDPVDGVNLWPYFKFERYAEKPLTRAWRCVRLENQLVRVDIFPEIGGKIWSAFDKASAKEFLYCNSVVKFRNISMRGPWTSGGIEFNFGMIGHAPTTSTPVDYFCRTNGDGSASCFVGALELITHTRWCVEVRLGAEERGFETAVTWYNASGVAQPCYQWMNAAYPSGGQYFFPGSAWIDHGGKAAAWHKDSNGRDLSFYDNNNFGPAKTYHVLNGDSGFFGVWWADKAFGCKHEAAIYDRLGRKIWIWSLSRNGAIWEDLLTDRDGQYVELQSGRYFNQPGLSSYRTPFKHPSFAPGATISFTERWSPVTDLKELVERTEGSTMASRPLTMPDDFDWESLYGMTLQAEQMINLKLWLRAEEGLRKVLAQEPHHLPALVLMAEVLVQRGHFKEALQYSEHALAIDTYHGRANFLSGVAFAQEGDTANALERFSVATLAPEFKAAALTRIAVLYCAQKEYAKSMASATRALESNPMELTALHLRLVGLRLTGHTAEHEAACKELLARFPLYHPARYELERTAFVTQIRCELPHEELLETASLYGVAGLFEEAAAVAALAPENYLAAVTRAWWLWRGGAEREAQSTLAQSAKLTTEFVFPFRVDSLAPLEWAVANSDSWKPRYMLALLLAHFSDKSRALELMSEQEADDVPYLLFRAKLSSGESALRDIRRAQALGDNFYAPQMELRHHATAGQWLAALDVARRLAADFPADGDIGTLLANALLRCGRYDESLAVLKNVHILPSEFTRNTRAIYREASLGQAIQALHAGDATKCRAAIVRSMVWDERLGVGKPYPDMIDMRLEYWLSARLAQGRARDEFLDLVAVGFKGEEPEGFKALDLLTALALRERGKVAEADGLAMKFGDSDLAKWCESVFVNSHNAVPALKGRAVENSDARLLALLFKALSK